MGANDGIVSTAGMVVGVASAAVSNEELLVSGIAAVLAGAVSMAVGEYVSVSTQRDSERAEIEHKRVELAANPTYGLEQLTGLVEAQGIDRDRARRVAAQLTKRDALTAHARLELGIDPKGAGQPVACRPRLDGCVSDGCSYSVCVDRPLPARRGRALDGRRRGDRPCDHRNRLGSPRPRAQASSRAADDRGRRPRNVITAAVGPLIGNGAP